MLHLNEEATKILNVLTDGVKWDSVKKIDNPDGSFMAVHVEKVIDYDLDDLFSVGHYYVQNGDLMSDPQVVFWKKDGNFFPLSFRNDGMGYFQEVVNEIDPIKRVVTKFYSGRLKDQVEFCNTWMINICDQQELLLEN